MSAGTTLAPGARRQPDHSGIRLPHLHRRLTPSLRERRDQVSAALRRFPGGPPVRPA